MYRFGVITQYRQLKIALTIGFLVGQSHIWRAFQKGLNIALQLYRRAITVGDVDDEWAARALREADCTPEEAEAHRPRVVLVDEANNPTQVFDLDGWIIPEGLPEDRLARVKDFVRFATDTQRLADQAKYISYGPARASSAPAVPDEMKQHMPTDPANAGNTFLYNYEFWADYRDDIDAKFQSWLAQ